MGPTQLGRKQKGGAATAKTPETPPAHIQAAKEAFAAIAETSYTSGEDLKFDILASQKEYLMDKAAERAKKEENSTPEKVTFPPSLPSQ